MPGGAARDDRHAVDSLERLAVETERAGEVGRRARRRLDGAWLLVNLLQHEVRIAVLLGRRGVPGDRRRRLADGVAVEPDDPHALVRQHGHLAVVEDEDVARVCEDRRDVGGEEEPVRADGDDQRRAAVFHAQEGPRRLRADDAERVGAVESGRRTTRRAFEPLVRVPLDQMRDDLGVRLRFERVPVALERLPQVRVVLDDAVVDDRDGLRAVAMRVRVRVTRLAMGRPARVGDAQRPLQRFARQDALEGGDLPHTPAHLEAAVVNHRHARRVVAPIFEPLEPVHENRDGVPATDVSDDSTHGICRLVCSLCPHVNVRSRLKTLKSENPQKRIGKTPEEWAR